MLLFSKHIGLRYLHLYSVDKTFDASRLGVMVAAFSSQVSGSDGKHSILLQAESKHQREEWMATIRNIAAGLYLHDNPRQAAMQALQSSNTQPVESPAPSASLELTTGEHNFAISFNGISVISRREA